MQQSENFVSAAITLMAAVVVAATLAVLWQLTPEVDGNKNRLGATARESQTLNHTFDMLAIR